MIKYKCQMTAEMSSKEGVYCPEPYYKCGRPAKYKVPKPFMKVEYVCGIHKNSVDKGYEKRGSKLRCIKIEKELEG